MAETLALGFLKNRILTPERRQYLRVVQLLVRRELKVKYRGTFLGYIWSMLNPLFFMLITTFIFSRFMKGIPNYNVYVLVGILSWNLASTAIIGGTHSVANNAGLLRKIKMPVWVFPLVPLSSGAVNLVLAFVPFLIVALASGVIPGWGVVALPAVLLLFSIFLSGVSLALSTLNVFFKDVGHVLEPVLQLTFYATPIIYDRRNQALPEFAAKLLGFNPFTHFIEGMRACLLTPTGPSALNLLQMLAIALMSFAVGALVYKSGKKKIIFNI